MVPTQYEATLQRGAPLPQANPEKKVERYNRASNFRIAHTAGFMVSTFIYAYWPNI
jgi:hypothetical protein